MSVVTAYPPERNTGAEWGELDTRDLMRSLYDRDPVECRTPPEIRARARELGVGHLLVER